MKNSIKLVFLTLFVICLSTAVHAQPGLDDDGVQDAPLDGGISLLVCAGLAYGAKKWKDQSNEMQQK